MDFFKRKKKLWFALILPLLTIMAVYIVYVMQHSIESKVNSVLINSIIYSDDYELNLTEKEKLWLKENATVRVGISRDFPPFGFMTDDNKHVGFSADYMRLLEYRLGVTFDLVKDASWKETIDLAKAGELDMVSALVNTKERQQFLNFTKPYVINPTSIFSKAGSNHTIKSLKDLNGKKLAIEAGSFPFEQIQKQYPDIILVAFNNTALALKEVYLDKAVAFIGNTAVANHRIQKHGLYSLSESTETEFSSTHSIGIVKKNILLTNILDKTLSSISNKDKALFADYWFGVGSGLYIPKLTAFKVGLILTALLAMFVFWAAILLKENKKLNKRESSLKDQSEIDHLTRLGNRRKFFKQLNKEIKFSKRNNEAFTLIFMDLDRFKEVNDYFGHAIGDLLLIEVSKRICDSVDGKGIVARLGGDEFVIILPKLSDKEKITQIVEEIRVCLDEKIIIESNEIHISTSMGITCFPQDTNNQKRVIMNADQAMYNSKKRGRNCYSFYNKGMQQEALYRSGLIRDLRIAVQKMQFEVHYQPIVNLHTNKICKAEALIRWNHAERGFVPPNEFIPIAEEINHINIIGNWVFKEAIGYTEKLINKFGKNFQMSVNMSPVQFRKNGFDIDASCKYAKAHGVSGGNIVLEITEGVLMEAKHYAKEKLHKLRQMKVDIAIDDFGTGYSSLSYLKKFHIDYLKIDQSFVQNLSKDSTDISLIKAIIVMAHSLDLKVIAEGIETKEQKEILFKAGCDFGQGYYFSKALDEEGFSRLIENWDDTPSKLQTIN